MKEAYISEEVAALLQQKGFHEPCTGLNKILCRIGKKPLLLITQQKAMKWLREVHNRYIEICTDRAHNLKDIVFRPAIYDKELDCLWESDNFSTYEQACEAAIKYCLENLINVEQAGS